MQSLLWKPLLTTVLYISFKLFFSSWSFISDHISRISPVHLLGRTNIAYDAKSLRIYLLWNPEIQGQSDCFSQQNQDSGARTSSSIAEPHCIYGLHRNCLKFPSCPEGSGIPGKLPRWTCQFIFRLSTFLSGAHHGGADKETDKGYFCCTDSSYYS